MEEGWLYEECSAVDDVSGAQGDLERWWMYSRSVRVGWDGLVISRERERENMTSPTVCSFIVLGLPRCNSIVDGRCCCYVLVVMLLVGYHYCSRHYRYYELSSLPLLLYSLMSLVL